MRYLFSTVIEIILLIGISLQVCSLYYNHLYIVSVLCGCYCLYCQVRITNSFLSEV